MLFAGKADIFSGWIIIKLCTTIDFYFDHIDMLMQDVRPCMWPMFMGHRLYAILVSEYVFYFASYTRKIGGMCWQSKLSSMKICGIKAKMSSLTPKLIFIQVWHVYALCMTWGLFLDISNIIYKEIQRYPKTISKMGSTYWFECTSMKPSSRQSKRKYGWPNLESVWGNCGDVKFSTLLKPVKSVARTGQTDLRC
jgi:hypothetical protein